jgi:hypothetical protein
MESKTTKRVAVVIPLYKSEMTLHEKKSFLQCCKILKNYPIILVVPVSFKVDAYQKIAKEYDISLSEERFDDTCFLAISSYNRLLLSKEFYVRFSGYEYMLIYQLDAYVFKDELEFWCNERYDYIGAPLIGKFEDLTFSQEMRVGNGGFSLRKINSFISFFESKQNVFSARQIITKISLWKKPYTRIFIWFLMLLGWRNKPYSVAKNWKYNEDDFWSGVLDKSRFNFSKPDPRKAMEFAFERFPGNCFEITGKLPFGCHAWEKYEYESFWKKYIE